VLLVKDAPASAVCKSTGDPHYRTFYGVRHNYYGIGAHVLARLDIDDEENTSGWGVEVQTVMKKWNTSTNGPSNNDALAIKLYDSDSEYTLEFQAAETRTATPIVRVSSSGVWVSSEDSDADATYNATLLEGGSIGVISWTRVTETGKDA
ncbi:hypothetical protein KIPB_013949, partial [Kipferlia bialata]